MEAPGDDPLDDPENQEWIVQSYWRAIGSFVGDLAANLIMGKLGVSEVLEKIKGIRSEPTPSE